jgi:hypothetical protein
MGSQGQALSAADCRYLQSLSIKNAESDARAAIARHDYRLLGAYGYSLVVPGLDSRQSPYDFDVRPIACTSDTPESMEYERLNLVASDYAKKYNAVILAAHLAIRKARTR